MSRELKIILAIVVGLLVVCMCVVGIGIFLFQRTTLNLWQEMANPTSAAQAAHEIARWDVPDGYEQAAVSLLGLNMVVIAPAEDQIGHIISLAQVPASAGLNRQQVEEQLQVTILERMQRQGLTFQEVGEEMVTIRGQSIPLKVREGQDENGEAFRQVSGVFEGNGGPALLLITAPASVWDPDFVENFIASIQ